MQQKQENKTKQTILIYMFKDRENKSLCQEIQNLNQIKTFKIQVLPRILFFKFAFLRLVIHFNILINLEIIHGQMGEDHVHVLILTAAYVNLVHCSYFTTVKYSFRIENSVGSTAKKIKML